ncbi:MAG: hypothetical protein Q9166_002943 [cf. Caloplaca sp. 2 TL-2023]
MGDLDTVVWNFAEANLQETRADVFEIFDCCYAGMQPLMSPKPSCIIDFLVGDLGRGRGFGTRCFEFLGATSSGATTKCPGPNSFTSGLIWALDVLAKESGRFTTSTLANKIREAPNFPKKQVPILIERNDLASLQRIVIAPLSKGDEVPNATPAEKCDTTTHQPWGFLDLRISLERRPTRTEVAKFAKDASILMQTTELKGGNVKWGRLYRSLSADGLHLPMLNADLLATKYDNAFDINDKVWMKNPDTGIFEWVMYVVEKQYDSNKPGWEYKVKDAQNVIYKEGAWVSQKELVDA